MGKKIECLDSFDMGLTIGLRRGMEKQIGLYFDYMKNDYLKVLNSLDDQKLLEELHDNIYTTIKSRHEFELLLNTLEHAHQEQAIINKRNSDS